MFLAKRLADAVEFATRGDFHGNNTVEVTLDEEARAYWCERYARLTRDRGDEGGSLMAHQASGVAHHRPKLANVHVHREGPGALCAALLAPLHQASRGKRLGIAGAQPIVQSLEHVVHVGGVGNLPPGLLALLPVLLDQLSDSHTNSTGGRSAGLDVTVNQTRPRLRRRFGRVRLRDRLVPLPTDLCSPLVPDLQN